MFCMNPSCPGGTLGVEGCPNCGWTCDNTHYAQWGSNTQAIPALRYAPPTEPMKPRPPVGPCGPGPCGPVTELERVVELGISAYDATKEPLELARDFAVKGVFAGLRRLFYRRR